MPYVSKFNERQEIAISYLSPSSEVEQILYGGGVYGGKSWLGCYWQILRRLKYPNTRGLIGRAELKKLQLSTMSTFWELCTKMNLTPGKDYAYNGQLNRITWFNGSETILMDMADTPSDPDFHRFGSLELTDYFLDEAAEISAKAVEILDTRVRYNLVNGRPKGLITCNPTKGWLYNDFWTPYKEGKLPPHRAFVQALLKDNTIVPNEAYQKKMERLNERDRKRLLDGDWDYDDSPDKLFDYDSMLQMFNTTEPTGEGFITCDPAAMGNDRTIIMIWKGMHCIKVIEHVHKYPHEVANILRELASSHSIKLNNVLVDSDGLGIGVKGILGCREFLNGSSAIDKEHFFNLKSECYFKLSEAIGMNRIHFSDHSQRDNIVKELDLVRDASKEDKKKQVSSKDQIKARLGRSPDYADALMMRMHFELRPNYGKYSF
jgi:phage terminase large subunit